MNEKYLAGMGGCLILILFGIIVTSVLFEGIDEDMALQNKTPGLAQLHEIRDVTKEKLENNTGVDDFQELVGNLIDQMKEKITIVIKKTFSDV